MKFNVAWIVWPSAEKCLFLKGGSREEVLEIAKRGLAACGRWPAPYPDQRKKLGDFLEGTSDQVKILWGLTYELIIWRAK